MMRFPQNLLPLAQISSSNFNVRWNMMLAPLLQSYKGKFSFDCV